ncbi:hypothetical protein Tco_0814295 [Tanacetum coccineum]
MMTNPATRNNVPRHESYTSFGDSMLIAFYLAVLIFLNIVVLPRLVEGRHESYTSFGDSMLTAFYLAVMIFRIWCLAADSGRMAECEICCLAADGGRMAECDIPLTSDIIQIPSGRVNGQVTPGNLKATSTRLTKRERIDVADHTQRMYGL